jgi:hypothetical protein
MMLIRNEIEEETKFTTAIPFDAGLLNPDAITMESLSAARDYIEKVRRYYIEVSRNAVEARDQKIIAFERTDRDAFIMMKKQYTNESLEEFVKNENEKDKIKRYRDRLYQNYDQIFFDPPHPLVKAHFYAPRKQVFGVYTGTLAVNTGVIWIMTIALYILLNFRVLHRILESSEKFRRVMKDRRERREKR